MAADYGDAVLQRLQSIMGNAPAGGNPGAASPVARNPATRVPNWSGSTANPFMDPSNNMMSEISGNFGADISPGGGLVSVNPGANPTHTAGMISGGLPSSPPGSLSGLIKSPTGNYQSTTPPRPVNNTPGTIAPAGPTPDMAGRSDAIARRLAGVMNRGVR